MSHHPTNATERTEYYLEQTFWPFCAALLVVLFSASNANQPWIVTTAIVCLSILIAARTVHGNLHWQAAAVVGGFCGGLLGLIAAIEMLVFQFSVPDVFGLVPRTAIAVAEGALAAGLVTEILYVTRKASKKVRSHKNQTIKREQREGDVIKKRSIKQSYDE